jgi:hypothetical protein
MKTVDDAPPLTKHMLEGIDDGRVPLCLEEAETDRGELGAVLPIELG